MGRPLFVTDKLPSLGATGDVAFMDPTHYAVGERAELIIAAADQKSFTTNETIFRVWRRVDGAPIYSSAITPTDSSTTISPFVVLSSETS
jgi:HK97 family phage major capsid protein